MTEKLTAENAKVAKNFFSNFVFFAFSAVKFLLSESNYFSR